MPPRLYYWIALGGSAIGIGVALMLSQWTLEALIAFGIAFLLIAIGGIVELLVPFMLWEAKGFGKFDRAIKRRIKKGLKILKPPELSYDDWRGWQHDTSSALSRHLVGEWHPQITRFQGAGGYNNTNQEYYRAADSGFRKVLTVQQLNVLSDIRRILRNKPESIMILDSNIILR